MRDSPQTDILLSHIPPRIHRPDIKVVDPEPILVEEPRRPRDDVDRVRPIRGVDILRLVTVSDQDVVHLVPPDEIEILAADAGGEGPVRVRFVLADLEGEVVVRDDDLLAGAVGGFEFGLEPSPFRRGVVLEFGQVGHEGDRVEEDEAVAVVAEGVVVADVVVAGELLEGGDVVDVVVAREEVDGDFEVGEGGLEGLDFVVIAVESSARSSMKEFLITDRLCVRSPTAIQKSKPSALTCWAARCMR